MSHGIREVLFFFFLIFLFRLLLRNQWAAGVAFALLFSLLNAFENLPVLNTIASFLILFGFAFVLLRWGLLAMAVCSVVSQSVGNIPITTHGSAWYFANSAFVIVCVLALVAWAFRTAVGGQKVFKSEFV